MEAVVATDGVLRKALQGLATFVEPKRVLEFAGSQTVGPSLYAHPTEPMMNGPLSRSELSGNVDDPHPIPIELADIFVLPLGEAG